MVDTSPCKIVQTHRTNTTKSEPDCEQWSVGDDDVSVCVSVHTGAGCDNGGDYACGRGVSRRDMYTRVQDVDNGGDHACGRGVGRRDIGYLCMFFSVLV